MCESHRQVAPVVGATLPQVETEPKISDEISYPVAKQTGGIRTRVGDLLISLGNRLKGN